MRKGVTKPDREYQRYERLGGNRPGRNVCVSGRITDAMDDKIDAMAEESNTTRSKIVNDAIVIYIKKNYRRDTTAFTQKDTTTESQNTDSTLLTIIIEKDANGVYIGVVPTIEECYASGKTLKELLMNLQKVINEDLPLL